MQTEIKYGRKIVEGKKVGYATFTEGNAKIELICPPYKDLIVLKNGKPIKCTPAYVMVWTKVAGWLGTEELLACF